MYFYLRFRFPVFGGFYYGSLFLLSVCSAPILYIELFQFAVYLRLFFLLLLYTHIFPFVSLLHIKQFYLTHWLWFGSFWSVCFRNEQAKKKERKKKKRIHVISNGINSIGTQTHSRSAYANKKKCGANVNDLQSFVQSIRTAHKTQRKKEREKARNRKRKREGGGGRRKKLLSRMRLFV